MKILICGANGQLGIELQEALRSGKTDLGKLPSIYENAMVMCTDVEELDITNEDEVQIFFKAGAFDLVINCAAMTNVDGCEDHEELAFRVNACGAQNLARAAQSIGAKMVQISTDYVFSGNEGKEYVETDTPDPQSAYGRTKHVGEEYVLGACSTSFVVRTAWLFGASGPNFVLTMMRLARENGQITVVNDQFGNPTYANDLAYEILKIASTEDYGVYHCTNRGICSWYEFASAIVDAAGIECSKTACTTEEFKRPAPRPAYAPLRNKRLEDTIGDEMRSWQDALVAYIGKLQ